MIPLSLVFDLPVHLQLQAVLVLWAAALYLLARSTLRYQVGGMGLVASATMTFVYQGCFTFADPNYVPERGEPFGYLAALGLNGNTVARGAWISLVGLVGLVVGIRFSFRSARRRVPLRQRARSEKLPHLLTAIGAVGFILNALRVQFPMSGSTLEWMRNCATVGIALGIVRAARWPERVAWFALLGAIAGVYLRSGFLSYSFLAAAVVIVSVWIHGSLGLRPNRGGVAMVLAVYAMALTLFPIWMAGRGALRESLRSGDADLSSFVLTVDRGVGLQEAFDSANARLNQPFFIGRASERLDRGPNRYQNGRDFEIIPLALVPRVAWPEKPQRGGSADMARYTGIRLSEQTTMGTGPPLVSLVNFGIFGVFMVMALIGGILGRLDRVMGEHLLHGDDRAFATMALVAIPFADPYLTPFFIANGAMFGALASWFLFQILTGRQIEVSQV